MIIDALLLITVTLVCIYFSIRFRLKSISFYLVDSYIGGLVMYCFGAAFLYYQTPTFKFEMIATISAVALSSSVFGALITLHGNSKKTNRSSFILTKIDVKVVNIALFFSVLISLLFIYSVISNKDVAEKLLMFFSSNSTNYTSVRKTITSGTSGYFAPGYIKQFRDILGPISLISLIVIKPLGYEKKLLGCLFVIILAMLLSGQRSIVIVFLVLYFFVIKYSGNSLSVSMIGF